MKTALLVLLALSTLATPSASATPMRKERLAKPTECGDLLARIGRKPPRLGFDRCRYLPENQGKPLEAIYWVSGARAAAVEAYLIRRARLARLRRSCCQWDSPGGQFIVNDQRYFVTMVSEENTVSRRLDWPKIKEFAVMVETWTEEL